MKTKYIPVMLMLAMPLCVAAQDLSMPQASDASEQQQMPQISQELSDGTAESQMQAKYNTPSESYKAERNAIRKGNSYFKEGKFHQALEEYNRALAVNSGSVRGRYNKAVALLQLQSDDNKGTQNDPRILAGVILEEIIPDAKSYDAEIAEKAFYNLGNMAFNDEKYDQAIELYKGALRIQPNNMLTRENLRLAQLKKQEQEQNKDQQNQDKQDQQQQEQQQQQQDQQQKQDQQQQQQQQQQPMTQSAQQILQSMQNKENTTRKKVQEQEPAVGRPQSDKPW